VAYPEGEAAVTGPEHYRAAEQLLTNAAQEAVAEVQP
jgi:hypothetical protein